MASPSESCSWCACCVGDSPNFGAGGPFGPSFLTMEYTNCMNVDTLHSFIMHRQDSIARYQYSESLRIYQTHELLNSPVVAGLVIALVVSLAAIICVRIYSRERYNG